MTKKMTKAEKATNKKAREALKKLPPADENTASSGGDPQIEQGQPITLKEHMAALMYYDTIPEDQETVSFEKIHPAEAAKFISGAEKVLLILSKLDLILLKKDDPKLSVSQDRLKDQLHIERVILDFMKVLNVRKTGKHKTIQKMINPLFFPAGELAYRIVDAPYGS